MLQSSVKQGTPACSAQRSLTVPVARNVQLIDGCRGKGEAAQLAGAALAAEPAVDADGAAESCAVQKLACEPLCSSEGEMSAVGLMVQGAQQPLCRPCSWMPARPVCPRACPNGGMAATPALPAGPRVSR